MKWVNDVSQTFGHFSAVSITHDAVQQNLLKDYIQFESRHLKVPD